MIWRIIKTEQQICYRALCGMYAQYAAPGTTNNPVRAGVLKLAMAAMRKTNLSKGMCEDCPYRGKCGQPDESNVLQAHSAMDDQPVLADPSPSNTRNLN